ncbi:MAG: LysR family transcriptional regulator [Clostridiales Family XIII bacterium]|jgi:DNA-binding transcriptional LysR family regulator|nr:LysR family transcriptional regulator [Clostridiales Family XIII bacterium]
MYSITFQQIETFLTIAKYMNLSRAAEAMYISQPALSKTLQRLEERIGIRLFLRGNSGVVLTPEGAYLYKTLEPLYASLNETIDTAQAISSKPSRTLRIVQPPVYDVAVIFEEAKDGIRRFAAEHPGIVLTESLCEFKELRNAIEYSTADIAIIYDFVLGQMKNVSYKRITEFSMYLAISSKHPLAKGDKLPSIKALASEVFYRVGYLDDEASREIYKGECEELGFAPEQFVFVSNVQTLVHAIREMKGVSICGRFNYFGQEGDVKYYPLPPFKEKKYVVAAWQADRLTAEAKLFVNMLPGDVKSA